MWSGCQQYGVWAYVVWNVEWMPAVWSVGESSIECGVDGVWAYIIAM